MQVILAENRKNVYNDSMLQSSNSGKTPIIGVIIASVCILVYLGALVSLIIRINTSMEERRLVAEQEFYDLADLASSAGVLSFMDDTFMEIIQNALNASNTIEGIIITGPNGEYGFEKEDGRALQWVNNTPRFRNRLDFSRQDLYRPLRIQGLRNVTIQAVAGALDYAELASILKQALFLVAAALILAFFTLLMESLRKGKGLKFSGAGKQPAGKSDPKQEKAHATAAVGGYSQRGHVVWEENTEFRLTEELLSCAASGQDLSFIVIEYKASADESFYTRFAADAARFFSSRDFVCEKGEHGVSIICPGLSLDAGFLNADEFHNRIMGKYPAIFKNKTDLCIGISSRSERPVNAERLIFEADEALERSMMDPVSHIVAFKSDPEKYRAFMESQNHTAN
jgi:hypothetical protein